MIPSLPKLLALGAVIWAVWVGFRMLERRGGGRDGSVSRDGDGNDGGRAGKGNRALDLEECSVCRAWVAAEACEREACPYRDGAA